MQSLRPAFNILLIALVEVLLLVAWKHFGVDGAANILGLWIWFQIVCSAAAILVQPTQEQRRASLWAPTLHAITMAVALAWFGYFVTASSFAIAQTLFIGRIKAAAREVS